MNRQYDFKELIRVYGEAKKERRSTTPQEQREYYPALLKLLEKAFRMSFSYDQFGESGDFEKLIFFRHFMSTLGSYQAQQTPWSHYLEAGLLIRKLEEQGEKGQRILRQSDWVQDLIVESRRVHLEMAYDLFQLIWGTADTVVTSEQLLDWGFDDSKEPPYWFDE